MSHVGSYATGLSALVVPELLLKTIQSVAAELKGKLVLDSKVKDYSGQAMGTKCRWAIFCKDMPNGLGIMLDANKPPEFVADVYGKEKQFDAIRNRIKQVYVALAAAEAAKRLGYPVQEIYQVQGNIQISLKVGS